MLFTSAIFYVFIGFILVILLLFSLVSSSGLGNFIKKQVLRAFQSNGRKSSKEKDSLLTIQTKSRKSSKEKDSLLIIQSKESSKFKHYNLFLLSISLIFYGLLNGSMLILLLLVVTWDYFLSHSIFMANIKHKKYYLYISLCFNLGILFFYKYSYFLAKECLNTINILTKFTHLSLKSWNLIGLESWNLVGLETWNPIGLETWNSIGLESLNLIGLETWVSSLDGILLPLGISFFTFQSLSCTIDVYRGKVDPAKSWTDYALYVSFFPQLVAGPIVKAKDFLPQIVRRLEWAEVPLFSAISWIAMGLIKKSILADRLAIIVDSVFLDPNALDWSFVCLGVVSYTIQIFLDFSGYSDIAIGIALLFGFRLPTNFNMPYLSSSFSEFWNRWHITLSSWLRDYLYIPLGGNRVGKFHSYRNLFIVMLLGGIWHGASWNFLIWGGLHGLFLAMERMFLGSKKSKENSTLEDPLLNTKKFYQLNSKAQSLIYLRKIFAVAFVFIVTNILWIFFRSPNWETTTIIFNKLILFESGLFMPYSWKIEFFTILAIVILGHFAGIKKFHPENWEKIPIRYSYSLLLAILTIGIALLSVVGKPFIYFVF